MDTQIPPQPVSTSYKVWHSLFILGCIFNIGLTFVPSMRVKVAGFFTVEEKLISNLQLVQLAFQTGHTGLGLLAVLFFAAWVAFLVMAIVYQKSWVFIAGASLSALSLLLGLFSVSSGNVEYLLIPRIIVYVADVFMLSGFIAKPPVAAAETK